MKKRKKQLPLVKVLSLSQQVANRLNELGVPPPELLGEKATIHFGEHFWGLRECLCVHKTSLPDGTTEARIYFLKPLDEQPDIV